MSRRMRVQYHRILHMQILHTNHHHIHILHIHILRIQILHNQVRKNNPKWRRIQLPLLNILLCMAYSIQYGILYRMPFHKQVSELCNLLQVLHTTVDICRPADTILGI